MLVFTRKRGEAVAIGKRRANEHAVKVTVLEVCGMKVKLGFEAAGQISVHRWEVWERICTENLAASLLPADMQEPTDQWSDDGGI
jgi:carbon storage regulator CsrA